MLPVQPMPKAKAAVTALSLAPVLMMAVLPSKPMSER
jgi:hypothetical protein